MQNNRRNRNKRFTNFNFLSVFTMFILITSLILSGGCAKESDRASEQTPDNEIRRQSAKEAREPAGKNLRITLFFTDNEAAASGERGMSGFVTPVYREIPFTDDEEEALQVALAELIKGPRPEDGHIGRTIPETVVLLDASIADGTATVNLSAAASGIGGSLGTTIFMESLVYTATQFPKVKNIVVLEEGQPFDNGHIVWDKPISPDDL